MTEKSKIEIEELLNALVEDQATERQKNEFARLIRHDPSVADQLAAMQRQKQILGALPVESAPASLANDVCSALEHKKIVGVSSGTEPTVVGVSHLFMRRLLTTAAMLLLPIGVLSFVIFEIIKPASSGPVGYPPVGDGFVQNDSSDSTESMAPIVVKELPFDGILTFRTDQPITVSNYAEKMIFDQGLISHTVPKRTVDIVTYQITAPPDTVAVLIDSLEGVWLHCQQVVLSVADDTQGSRVDIPNVQIEQVKTLTEEDNPEMLNRLAGQYALANIKKDSMFARDDMSMDTEINFADFPPLTIPILTGRNELPLKTIDPSQPAVRLRIRIERSTE
ncbi:MAG: hypothetical protein ACYTEU_05215 [Planctomycetota bacterium]|jgi:hypothetical protein